MAHIIRQTTVVRDGWHNAFTDLVHWRGQYFVSYRKGAAHVSIDGEACVSVSFDRQRFREAARLKTAGDVRDPKLVPMGDERLAMLCPSWLGGAARRQLQQYVAFSDDGHNWSTLQPILDVNHWLWRVRKVGDRYFGLCYHFYETRDAPRPYVTELVVSDDMLEWKTLARVGTEEMSLGESDLHVFDDREMWVVTRRNRDPHTSVFSSAKPPYDRFDNADLGVMIHAPVICNVGGVLYVAGRRSAAREGDETFPFMDKMSLGVWRLERGAVTPVLRIPATGDCSYPGMIVDPEGRVCLSYYSQHAYHMGVIDDVYVREDIEPHDKGRLLPQNDVYFAELRLP